MMNKLDKAITMIGEKELEIIDLKSQLDKQEELTEMWKGRYIAENEKLLKLIENDEFDEDITIAIERGNQ